jgi:hypothetical protein
MNELGCNDTAAGGKNRLHSERLNLKGYNTPFATRDTGWVNGQGDTSAAGASKPQVAGVA